MNKHRRNILIIFLLALASRGAFVYKGGMGDPDPVVMAAGMAMELTGKLDFAHAFLYGRQVSPGIYFLIKGVYPLFFDSPVHLIAFLNWLSIISFSISACLLYGIFLMNIEGAAAFAGCMVFLFTPIAWEATTYFHPIVPAIMLLLAAFLVARNINLSLRGAASLVLATILAAASFCMRTEVIFAAPALLLLPLFTKSKLRNLTIVIAITLAGVIAYFALMRHITDISDPRLYGVRDYIRKIMDLYESTFSPGGLVRSGTWMVLGLGIFTFLFTSASLWRNVIMRSPSGLKPYDRCLLIPAVLWILPAILFWLPQPVPILRHYLLPALGLAWLLAYLTLGNRSRPRLVTLTAVIIAGNLLLPEGVYRIYNAVNASSPKSPHGSFFYFHAKQREVIKRYNRLQAMVLGTGSAHQQPGHQSDSWRLDLPGSSNPRDSESSTSESNQGPRRKIVLVDWQGYGYVLYALAISSSTLDVLPEITHDERVFVHPYRLEGMEIDVVHAKIADNLASGVVIDLAGNSSGNVIIYAPREAPYIEELRRVKNAVLVSY